MPPKEIICKCLFFKLLFMDCSFITLITQPFLSICVEPSIPPKFLWYDFTTKNRVCIAKNALKSAILQKKSIFLFFPLFCIIFKRTSSQFSTKILHRHPNNDMGVNKEGYSKDDWKDSSNACRYSQAHLRAACRLLKAWGRFSVNHQGSNRRLHLRHVCWPAE